MRRGPWALEADKALRSLSIPQEALYTSTSVRPVGAFLRSPTDQNGWSRRLHMRLFDV